MDEDQEYIQNEIFGDSFKPSNEVEKETYFESSFTPQTFEDHEGNVYDDGDTADHISGCFDEAINADSEHEGWQAGYDY